MAFSTGNQSGAPMSEINVTPLVDVMLVLLIIFMITAPLMSHKVKVELPKATLNNIETKPIVVQPTTKDQVESKLSVEAQKTPQPPINVRGDRTTKYRVVQEIVQIAQNQGMRKV